MRGEALGRVEEGGMLEQTGALGAKAGRREVLGGRPVLFPWKCFPWNPCMSQGTWELPEMIRDILLHMVLLEQGSLLL